MDPTLRPPVDVRMALAFPMRDPGWPGKLTLGAAFCVLALLLIGIPIVAGYLRRLFVRAVEDVDAPLPEWEVAQDLEDGLPVLAVLAVYGLAGFVLVQIPVLGLLLALVPAVAARANPVVFGQISGDVPQLLVKSLLRADQVRRQLAQTVAHHRAALAPRVRTLGTRITEIQGGDAQFQRRGRGRIGFRCARTGEHTSQEDRDED